MFVRDCEQCVGCPLRGDGSQQYQPDNIKPGAPVFLLGEQAGADPLASVEKQYLGLAGLRGDQVSTGHAVRCMVDLPAPVTAQQFDKGKRGDLERGIEYCNRVHSVRPSAARLVVTQGDYGLFGATGQRSSHEWRGWLLPYAPPSDRWLSEVWTPGPGDLGVLATVSLADLRAMPTLTFGMRADWVKVGRILRGEWPQPLPEFLDYAPVNWPRVSSFDTEFQPDGTLDRYSLYDGTTLRVVEARNVRAHELPETATVVMHNEDADVAYLRGFLRGGRVKTEDTMLMSAALYSDLPHSLAYWGSVVARTNRWKHLFHRNPRPYSAGDALGTWDMYLYFIGEFKADPLSYQVYREELYPLLPIIMEARTVGLELDQGRVQAAMGHYSRLKAEVVNQAQSYVGWPINLGSSEQVGTWLYSVEQIGAKKRGKRAVHR